MTDTSLGFRAVGRLSGGDFTIRDFTFKDTETLTKGDLGNIETGEIDLAATGDTALLGPVQETVSGTDSTTTLKVITDPDVILEVYDTTARAVGATLDISGTTGAQTIAASSNKEFVVYANFTNYTHLIINPDHHVFNKAT